ncbi:MAG: tyrosine-protein phosphatase [Bacilli bacterium]|nr:tyrosine-protein phosphatase [Bacilli bacterium]
MKKTNILLLSMLSVLAITGCGGKGGNENSSAAKPTVEPFVLNDPEDTTQLSENCKRYVDDMRAQEEANGEENKYMLDGNLFHPTDEVRIDAKNEDGSWKYRDAVDYTDEEKRIEQQSQKSDKSKGVALSFSLVEGVGNPNASYTIQVSTDDSFNDDVIELSAAPDEEVVFKNLFQSTEYYWRVVGDDKTSQVKSFETADYPRWIDGADMFNIRDAGGYMTSSGQRVKQGLIYRGGEITSKAFGGNGTMSSIKHQFTGTDEAKDIFRNVMKIGNELDLRRTSDLQADNNYNRCYFAEKDENGQDDIVWTNVQLNSWESFLTNTADIRACFDAFAHADEKPVYYHCHGGADRTGTLGFFLLGALGVSYSDIVIDYELTSYSSIIAPTTTSESDCLRRHYQRGTYDHWNEFIPNVEKTQGWDKSRTLQDNIQNFLVKVAGVPQATLDRFVEIMLWD